MTKKAIYGLMLVVLLPLTGYFVLKGATDSAVVVPRHYLPDSVITRTENGKQYSDTVWHKVPDFKFKNQLGQTVSLKDLEGKVIVADFFFTRCPTICPGMTRNMKRLQEGIRSNAKVGNRDPDFIHYLSISIDPERDSVKDLKRWADRFQVDPQNWWLLTGDRDEIYDLSINHLKLLAQSGGTVDTSFIHTDFFVLIDRNRNVRGYYHGLDDSSLQRLSTDLIILSLVKDPSRKSALAGKLGLLAVVFGLAIILVTILMIVLKRKKNESYPG